MTTTAPLTGQVSKDDARVETHATVLPPDVEGLKQNASTETGGDQLEEEASTEVEHLKSKGTHELCHHVHHSDRAPWLRAMILGASDGLVSVSSLMLGVAAGSADQSVMVLRCVQNNPTRAVSITTTIAQRRGRACWRRSQHGGW